MTIDCRKLKAWPFEEVEQTYSARDTILYALGIGIGTEPTNPDHLRFLYEERLEAFPTMAAVLAGPGLWLKDTATGVDGTRLLHGEQSITLLRPLPADGTVTARSRVTAIADKGAGKGALIVTERTLIDKTSGEEIAHLANTTFCRGDGGYGGPSDDIAPPHILPDRAPDEFVDLSTLPQQALIYRLSGDYNSLHIDPEAARQAGFEQPILHGLSTLGVAAHAILSRCCNYDPKRFKGIKVRFSGPVLPGETIRTEIWRDGETVSFRARVVERDVIAINNGCARIA